MKNTLMQLSLALAFSAAVSCGASPAAAHKAPPKLTEQQLKHAQQEFAAWLPRFEARARHEGVSRETIEAALGHVHLNPDVLNADRRQPEFTMSYAEYEEKFVIPRITTGREMLRRHAPELNAAANKYGVPPQYIVALWGFESAFSDKQGKDKQGKYYVPEALATLAAAGRVGKHGDRREMFADELIAALHLIDKGYRPADEMYGSWAACQGKFQFIPTAILKYAVDGDNDGIRDIWNNNSDAFASAANKLSGDGWHPNEPWGREVSLPPRFPAGLIGAKIVKPVAEWRRLGVTVSDGGPIQGSDPTPAAIVAPGFGKKDYQPGKIFITYNNFRTVEKWNNSDYFAAGIGELADAIAAPAP